MKQESDLKPKNKYIIENIKDGRCDVVFYDLDSIVETEDEIPETKEKRKVYSYNVYREKMNYNQSLIDILENNYNEMLSDVKKVQYDKLATKVREQRNRLLQESDKEMALDRMNFNIPETINMTTIIKVIKDFFDTLSKIKKSEWAIYRQKLRDITTLEGFPYNVQFPEKPKKESVNNDLSS